MSHGDWAATKEEVSKKEKERNAPDPYPVPRRVPGTHANPYTEVPASPVRRVRKRSSAEASLRSGVKQNRSTPDPPARTTFSKKNLKKIEIDPTRGI